MGEMSKRNISAGPALLAIGFLLFADSGMLSSLSNVAFRAVVFVNGIYLAVRAIALGRSRWAWAIGAVAIVFNPFLVVPLRRTYWEVIDIAAALILIFYALKRW